MPVRVVLELGDPLLRRQAQPVEDPRDPAIQSLIVDLWDTLHDFHRRNGWGRALAAPVIGVDQRVVVISANEQQHVLINPRFETWGRSQMVAYETCITFGSIWGQVYRPETVVVVALDVDGTEQRFELDGELARLFQHEIDHLDGLVWLDRDPDLATICTTNEYKRQLHQQSDPSS
jgi:peptide deformylase